MRKPGNGPPDPLVERMARVAFAFVVMNCSAVAGLVSAIVRRRMWR
jgi:hypothetical protein